MTIIPTLPSRSECPKRRLHTRCPEGYLAWHEWAEKKSKRHRQTRCPGCGRWAIWERKITPQKSHPVVLDKRQR